MKSWEDIKVGSVLLVRNKYAVGYYLEVRVLKISPSGRYVKIQYVDSERIEWVPKDELDIVEVLYTP